MIFAFDMDGTLINHKDKISYGNYRILLKLKRLGHKLIIVTGRPIKDALRSLNDPSLFDYLILNNGTYLYKPSNKKLYFKSFVSWDMYRFTKDIAKKIDSILALHTKDRVYRVQMGNSTKLQLPEFKEMKNFLKIKEIKNLKSLKLTQVSIFSSKETIKKIRPLFKTIENKVDIHIANEFYLDVNPKNTSKYQGIKWVCQKENWDVKDLIAFGDSDNDIEMLKNAKISAVMANGTVGAKKVADWIIGSHRKNSIKKIIKFWKKEKILNY